MKKREKDFAAQGDKAPSPVKAATQGGTPKAGGYDSAPSSDHMLFEAPHGHGGSNRGAH